MIIVKCSTPDCKGVREISNKTPNRSRIKDLCKPCLKAYTKAYQRAWYAKHVQGRPQKKRGGARVAKPKPDRPESPRAIWGRTHKCKVCGENPWPNHWFCPGICHKQASRTAGDTDTHSMPHVPMSGIN